MSDKIFLTGKNITAVVITKNEATNIVACLQCLTWCKQILVLDNESTDDTRELAKGHGATVLIHHEKTFANIRNLALKNVTTPWLFYVDADERVTPDLAKEICQQINQNNASSVLTLRRLNICYGSPLHHGGWENDLVERVFKKENLQGWQGEVHESPLYTGSNIVLKEELIHLTHRSTVANLYKSANWTPIEADLLTKKITTPVTGKLILRKGVMEFYRRYFKFKGYKDGMVGFVESLTQAINKFLIYIQIWEKKRKPSITERYQKKEAEVAKSWKECK